MVRPSEFTGTPFVAGSIFGERCWDVKPDGRLISPAQKVLWAPGENVAICNQEVVVPNYDTVLEGIRLWYLKSFNREVIGMEMNSPPHYYMRSPFHYYHVPESPYGCIVEYQTKEMFIPSLKNPEAIWTDNGEKLDVSMSASEVEFRPSERKHEFVPWGKIETLFNNFTPHSFESCECGFYAYLQGENEYLSRYRTRQNPRIVGVVEGYGETFIGEKGFRSKKAKIVALAPLEDPKRIKKHWWQSKKSHDNQVRNDEKVVLGFDPASFGGQDYSVTLVTVRDGTFFLPQEEMDQLSWDLIRYQYPDAVIFDSPSKMRLEFPATNLKEVL